jgi:filamentous hemagglutinin family protein
MRVNEVSRRVRTFQTSPFCSPRLVALTLGCFSVVSNDAMQAQIVPDNTVGSQVERVNAQRDRITGGTTRGSNLFHSFSEFNISEGRAAYFANPAAIKTIFSRVTGNNPSRIFGTLGVEGNANLFFINPNGIIFGSNATLDVRGSFIASTSNSIAFSNGENFSATNPNAPPLLTIDVPVPIGLVFESDNTGIIVNGANLETRQHLAIIGASIRSSGRISAPGQDITLATVPAGVNSVVRLEGTGKYLGQTQGSGQANLENRDILLTGGTIDAKSTETSGNIILDSAGDVLLSDEAVVDVRGGGGGSITVNAQNLEISGGARLFAGIGAGLGSLGAKAGNIEINAIESVQLQGNARTSTGIGNIVDLRSIGDAGDIIINTATLEGNGNSAIASATAGRGNAGNVTITATDDVSFSEIEGDSNGIGSFVALSAIGNGGNVSIKARSLSLTNGGVISTLAIGQGKGGNLTIDTSESVRLIGSGGLATGTTGEGNAGNLRIDTRQLLVQDGAAIATTTTSSGEGGNLTINASDSVRLLGTSNNSNLGGLATGATGEGNAGNLRIDTRQLLVQDGAAISTTTTGSGEGGDLTINASESVQLLGTAPDNIARGLETGTLGTENGGNAGDLRLNTRQLLVKDGAGILTSTGGSGEGGNLTINASESVRLLGTAANGNPGGLFTGTFNAENGGKAGNLNLATGQLLVKDGASISTTTTGSGAGGNLTINASESVRLLGTSANGQRPSSLSAETLNIGEGGSLSVDTKNLLLQDGAFISTATGGSGGGGNLTINASESVRLLGTSANGQRPSSLSAETLNIGEGGSLTVNTKNLLVRDGAQISTTTAGAGNAGSLTVKATESVRLIGTSAQGNIRSSLIAATIGTGNAGDLTVHTKNLLVQDGALVTTGTLNVGNAGSLTIKASESVQLIGTSANGRFPSLLSAETLGTGNGGTLSVDTKNLLVRDGAGISTNTAGEGNAGSLTVKATESVRLIGTSANSRFSSGLSAETRGTGEGGTISVDTKNLLVRDGALISTTTAGGGNAGSLTVNASESVRLISGISAQESLLSFLIASTIGNGNAGDLTVHTKKLLVQNGAGISTGTLSAGDTAGDAGSLTINATESIQLIGTSANERASTPSYLTTLTSGGGEGGILTVNTKNLLVRDNAVIFTTTSGAGNAGSLTVNASEAVQLISTSDNNQNRSLVSAETSGTGKGGTLTIDTKNLLVRDGAAISTSTSGAGDAGSLNINALESVQLIGTSANGRFSSSLQAEIRNTGEGGTLTVDTKNLLIRDGAGISTITAGTKDAGDIILKVEDSILLIGNDSGLFASTTEGSIGDGGSILIDPRTLTIFDGATISVNSRGIGTGGNVTLQTDSLTLDNGTISAETASTDGGNLTLDVQDLLLLRNGSQISTTAGTAQAEGNGGNIFINAGSIVAIPQEDSDITANAFEGDGGGVLINTQSIFGIDFRSRLTPLSDITASSERAAAGEVIINTSGVEPTRGVEALTEERINVEVAQGCQVGGTARGKISFYDVGRGGLPPSPDDLLNPSVTQEWLFLELPENSSSQQKVEPSFLRQPNNIVASGLIFSCQAR